MQAELACTLNIMRNLVKLWIGWLHMRPTLISQPSKYQPEALLLAYANSFKNWTESWQDAVGLLSMLGPWRRCESFLLLPAESTWNLQLRAGLYCVGMLWCCLGLAAITGVFMKALETIVSTHVEVRRKNPLTGVEQRFYERYWNGTIANLTLLALGTSAPEVLLTLIDALKHLGKPAGVLGPGTIIGSAAFNLLVILAVCVVAPKPPPQVRKIADYPVFVVELVASLWAYLWLLLILKVISPDRIEIWEAAVTLAQFPLFVLAAYGQDQGWAFAFLGHAPPSHPSTLPHVASGLSLDQLSTPTSPDHDSRPPTPTSFQLGNSLHRNLKYRAKAVKMVSLMGGGGPPHPPELEETEALAAVPIPREGRRPMEAVNSEEDLASLDVSEGQWSLVAKYGNDRLVIRHSEQPTDDRDTFSFTIGVSNLLEPLRLEHYHLNCAVSPPEEMFLGQHALDLEELREHEPRTEWVELESKDGSLARRGVVRVTLELRGGGGDEEYELAVEVVAPSSARGRSLQGGHSQQGSAMELPSPQQPPMPTPHWLVKRRRNWQRLKRQWALQFFDAMTAGAREDDEPEQDPSGLDLLLHFCAFYWKLVFAFIPPPTIWGGWAAFLSCLLILGGITALLEEFSLLFACTSGLDPFVTAVTFVAVGTSLPDLLASKIATELSREADSAIANINGSNSVNVFLGIGLPWLITAIYDQLSKQQAIVIATAGTYTVSLIAFFVTAIMCVGMLVVRRHFIGGELGGHRGIAWATTAFFTFLWMVYVTFSALKAYDVL